MLCTLRYMALNVASLLPLSFTSSPEAPERLVMSKET